MPDPKYLPLVERILPFKHRTAVIAEEGEYTYGDLIRASSNIASCLLDGRADLEESRVAFLAPPGFHWVAVQLGIWRAGGISVPLSLSHPRPELEYIIDNADAGIIVSHPDLASKLKPIAKQGGRRFCLTNEALQGGECGLPLVQADRKALILYTSGTTGKPKGVVTTHNMIEAQVSSLISAWEWVSEDKILNVLPLNHIHGIINIVTCVLWTGATCEFHPGFSPKKVWHSILEKQLTLFMAVPTIYVKLIEFWEKASTEDKIAFSEACSGLRLMVSGSAALPVGVFERWKEISGHTLLERYGMTEIGMALANPLHGERRQGCVGRPLPNVRVRLVDEEGKKVRPGEQGEIQVRGPGVFLEYWRTPEATEKAFRDDWFKTGDVAVVAEGYYRILGRSSVDIIKTGGYKVSALEIEEMILGHPDVLECAVVGIRDAVWGEKVSAALVIKKGSGLTLGSLRRWAKERMAPYKVPRQIMIRNELPRNALGKVSKPELAELFGKT